MLSINGSVDHRRARYALQTTSKNVSESGCAAGCAGVLSHRFKFDIARLQSDKRHPEALRTMLSRQKALWHRCNLQLHTILSSLIPTQLYIMYEPLIVKLCATSSGVRVNSLQYTNQLHQPCITVHGY